MSRYSNPDNVSKKVKVKRPAKTTIAIRIPQVLKKIIDRNYESYTDSITELIEKDLKIMQEIYEYCEITVADDVKNKAYSVFIVGCHPELGVVNVDFTGFVSRSGALNYAKEWIDLEVEKLTMIKQ